ncbi:MAG: sensor histidine kinase [Dehalococcoidia bacterium]
MFEALRWRLTAWYVLAFAVVFVVIGVSVFFWVDRRLSDEVDSAVARVTDQAQAALNQVEATEPAGQNSIGLGADEIRAVLANAALGGSADVFVLLVNPDGSIAANPGEVPLRGLPDQGAVARARQSGQDWRSATVDGHDLRIHTVSIYNKAGSLDGFVQAGKSLEARDHSLRTLAVVMASGGLAGLVLATLGGLVVAGIAIRPVRRSFQRQREFVADASHELRTPLTVIRTNAETLSTLSPGDEAVDDIVHESKYMTRLLDDLLILAGSDQDGIALAVAPVDLAQLARSAGRAASTLASDAGLAFAMSIDGTLMVRADPERLREVLLIVLDNAVKYTPRGGHVTLRAGKEKGDAVVGVDDTGAGVAPEEIPRLFDRFYRVDKARSRALGGAGLGLSIAREIMDAHGGSLQFKSEPGKGSSVTIRLPLATA